jgi:hypothetical protein
MLKQVQHGFYNTRPLKMNYERGPLKKTEFR